MTRLMTKEDRAQAKAYWIKGKTKVQPKGLDIEFYIDEFAGKFRLLEFKGTAGKPSANYWFKTAESRAAYMKRATESAKLTADYKAKRAAEKKAPRKLIGEPIACRCVGSRITVKGHAAWLWDGTPKYSSWYA